MGAVTSFATKFVGDRMRIFTNASTRERVAIGLYVGTVAMQYMAAVGRVAVGNDITIGPAVAINATNVLTGTYILRNMSMPRDISLAIFASMLFVFVNTFIILSESAMKTTSQAERAP